MYFQCLQIIPLNGDSTVTLGITSSVVLHTGSRGACKKLRHFRVRTRSTINILIFIFVQSIFLYENKVLNAKEGGCTKFKHFWRLARVRVKGGEGG
jgi:hypothetical protein